jgi:AcrR family transcriptional regulator
MSSSHLLYYFSSKEALIEQLYDTYSKASQSAMRSDPDLPPEERCRLWVENMFLESAAPAWDQRIILDMLAHAGHAFRFRRTLAKDAQANTAYLQGLFRHTPNTDGLSPRDMAALVQVLWAGFIVMSYIYPPLNKSRSRALFRQVVMKLAGLELQTGGTKTSKAKRGASRRRLTRDQPERLPNGFGWPAGPTG